MLNRILIIQTASMGDVILSTALAETIHSQYPDCLIDFLIKRGYESLFKEHPFINSLYLWDKREHKHLNLLKIICDVRKVRYDAVVNIQRHFSSGLVTLLARARQRIGFKKNPLSFGFTRTVEHNISAIGLSEHEIFRNHKLIDHIVASRPSKPALYPSKTDQAHVQSMISEKYISISPASLWFTKQYPVHKWAELVNSLDGGIHVCLLGASDDNEICQKLISEVGNRKVINLAGKLSPLQSAALMKGALMNFVNDSAPLHLASATNSAVTAVFCSTLPAFGFGPLADDSTVVETSLTLACKPCGLHGHKSCPEKHFLCAISINNNQLLKQIHQ